jgi:hypothetical protein
VNNEFDDLAPSERRRLIQATNLITTLLVAFLAVLKLVVLGVYSPPIPAFFIVIGGLINGVYIHRHGSLDVALYEGKEKGRNCIVNKVL